MTERKTNPSLEKARPTKRGNRGKRYDWLKPTQFKPGQSGNPAGRPPGKSLKVYLREYFERLTDEEKAEFFEHIDPELAWRMAEGNPQSNADITSGGKPLPGSIKIEFSDFSEAKDEHSEDKTE